MFICMYVQLCNYLLAYCDNFHLVGMATSKHKMFHIDTHITQTYIHMYVAVSKN